jgi:hypothetical protein
MATGLLKYTAPTVPAALTGWLAPGVSFTVDNTNVDSDLTAAVVLIRFTDSPYFYNAKADGSDIRFVDAADTDLKLQRRSFVKGTGVASGTFAVLCDVDHDAPTVIRGYCGKSDASDTSTTDVWNANYTAAWPLGETAAGAAGDFQDATAGNHDSTNTANQPTHSTGLAPGIGAATFANASSQRIQFANGIVAGTTALTIEGVGYITSYVNDRCIACQRDGAGTNNWQITLLTDGNLQFSIWVSGSQTMFSTTTPFPTNTPFYFAVTYDGTNVKWYKDGALINTTAETRTIDSASVPTFLGNDSYTGYLDGRLSDVRFSNVARSAALIKFTSAQHLETDHELTVANVAGTWEAVESAEITGEVVAAYDAATTADVLWLEIEDPKRANYIANASGTYVDRYTLADVDAWLACLVPMWATTLADASVSLRRVAQIPTAIDELPWRGRVFSGATPAFADAPVGYVTGQTLAELCITNPPAGLAAMR